MVHRLLLIISSIAILVMPVSAQNINNDKLKKQISDELAKQPGVFAVAFKNLFTGEELFINEQIRVEELAKACNTIPYEVITGISQRVKRVYFYE